MNGTRPIPVLGTRIDNIHFAWIARFIAGIVLAHLLLMANGPHAFASGEVTHSGHVAKGHQIEHDVSNESGKLDEIASSNQHCSLFAGDIARYDPVCITPPGVIALNPQERAPSSHEYLPLEPHPPDRSVFQVFLN